MTTTMATTVFTKVTEQMRSPQEPRLNPPLASCIAQLQDCLRLVKDTHNHQLAVRTYQALRDRLIVEQPDAVVLMDIMWEALLTSNQSTPSWERLCHSEQPVTHRMAASHIQLQQSYCRLRQKQ